MNINMNMNMTSLVELTWDESEDMVFSCEDGAQQVLMYAYQNECRMFQNVSECSRMHADPKACLQSAVT